MGGAVVLALFALAVCTPVILTFLASFKSVRELSDGLIPVLNESGGISMWKPLPLYPTLRHYIGLLFETPDFFIVFWNSMKITLLILAGQALIAIPAGWALAAYHFRGKRILLMVYIILMLMPFQVTMLPSYLVLERLRWMNTQASVIVPAIFSTFPVFIIYRGFLAIPKELAEAARVDGAGEFSVFFRIAIPLGMPGILSALCSDFWNIGI